jgi:hypothetical protein
VSLFELLTLLSTNCIVTGVFWLEDSWNLEQTQIIAFACKVESLFHLVNAICDFLKLFSLNIEHVDVVSEIVENVLLRLFDLVVVEAHIYRWINILVVLVAFRPLSNAFQNVVHFLVDATNPQHVGMTRLIFPDLEIASIYNTLIRSLHGKFIVIVDLGLGVD